MQAVVVAGRQLDREDVGDDGATRAGDGAVVHGPADVAGDLDGVHGRAQVLGEGALDGTLEPRLEAVEQTHSRTSSTGLGSAVGRRQPIRRGWVHPERRGPYRGRMNDGVQVIVPREVPLGGSAGDDGAAHAAREGALVRRRVVLRRPLRARRRGRERWHGRGAPPPLRARHGVVAVQRRGRAPRLARHGGTRAARRGQPHDRRQRHLALGGVDAGHDPAPRRAAVARAAVGGRPRSSRASSTTHPRWSQVADGVRAQVFVGSLWGSSSPVRVESPLVGAEVVLAPGPSSTSPWPRGSRWRCSSTPGR